MTHPATPDDEAQAVRQRYARRSAQDPRYSLLNPAALWALHERQRAMLAMLRQHHPADLAALRLLEVGCGGGGNLLDCLRMGFAPEHLAGIELLSERCDAARACLPAAVRLSLGDAAELLGDAGLAQRFDLVLQATVFSSLLDAGFQQRLADAMWAALKPGGAVLWYDFTVDNPRNPDVRGLPLRRVAQLFPEGTIQARRVTLAPPIARAVTRWQPSLYTLFNTLPWLRTHLFAWIGKPPRP